MFGSTKIVLLPCKEIEPKPTSGGGKNLLAKRAFVEEMFDSGWCLYYWERRAQRVV